MKRAIIATFLLFVLVAGTASCGNSPETNFQKMLENVPASYMDEYNLWYAAPGEARDLYGFGDMNMEEYIEAIRATPNIWASTALDAAYVPIAMRSEQLEDLIGVKYFDVQRGIFTEFPPPRTYSLSEGSFDRDLIRQNLLDLGYQETKYGDYTYLWKNDDYKIDLTSDIGKMVMAGFNRIMVTDKLFIAAPSTELLTGMLDARSGEVDRVSELESCQALADTLGDVLSAVLIPRERLLQPSTSQTLENYFDLPAARDWETLHLYEMAALAYRDNDEERFLDVSMYYTNKADAEADGDNLAARLQSYVFFTFNNAEQVKLADKFEVGKPVIKEYKEGSTLTVSCRYLGDYEERSWRFTPYTISGMYDLLFLAPDPAEYIKEA